LSLITRSGWLPDQEPTTAEGDLTTDSHVESTPGEDADADRAEAGTAEAGTADEPAGKPRRWRRVAARVTTGLAGLLVFFAILVPNEISRLTVGEFLRIPLEAILGVALLLVLPARARRIVAVLAGLLLGLLTIVKVFDMGFFAILGRPFNPVVDWPLLGIAVDTVSLSVGKAGAIAVTIGTIVLAVALLVLMPLAVLRVTRPVVRHRTAAGRTVGVLALAWIVCAATGVQVISGIPVAGKGTADLARDRAFQIRAGLRDHREFDAEAAVDPFRDAPADKLLSGLQGKDFLLTFIESYGRDAVEDPEFATQVGAVLDEGTRRLRAAGYSSRSAFLTSPTAGGASWLAHSTLLSGLWIDNQQRYRNLVVSDRLTLGTAFRRANWRTACIAPAVYRAWPEGSYFGYDNVYDDRNMGYRGPKFAYAPAPDQHTLSFFDRTEYAVPGRGPLMAELDLVSSHTPWAPLPQLIDWKDVGDGTVYGPMAAAGAKAEDVWRDTTRIRTQYRLSIEYTLSTLISYIEKFGNENLVLVFLGDHQPAPVVTGEDASRDVPITIVAHDPAVLDRISAWGWQEGLRPGSQAPVWRMNEFRDRFLTAYSS
jgi:hypothetical protein